MDQSHQKICERILQVCQDKIPDSEVFRQVSWIADGHWHWIQQHVPDFGDDSNWLLAQTWDKPSPRLGSVAEPPPLGGSWVLLSPLVSLLRTYLGDLGAL